MCVKCRLWLACADSTGKYGMTLYAHAFNPMFSERDSYTYLLQRRLARRLVRAVWVSARVSSDAAIPLQENAYVQEDIRGWGATNRAKCVYRWRNFQTMKYCVWVFHLGRMMHWTSRGYFIDCLNDRIKFQSVYSKMFYKLFSKGMP
jgi:hypothetical protein